ncbi:unnamed protein product, partial [Ectocarpus fasciculatus]
KRQPWHQERRFRGAPDAQPPDTVLLRPAEPHAVVGGDRQHAGSVGGRREGYAGRGQPVQAQQHGAGAPESPGSAASGKANERVSGP